MNYFELRAWTRSSSCKNIGSACIKRVSPAIMSPVSSTWFAWRNLWVRAVIHLATTRRTPPYYGVSMLVISGHSWSVGKLSVFVLLILCILNITIAKHPICNQTSIHDYSSNTCSSVFAHFVLSKPSRTSRVMFLELFLMPLIKGGKNVKCDP